MHSARKTKLVAISFRPIFERIQLTFTILFFSVLPVLTR
jgi:hypothetical protein